MIRRDNNAFIEEKTVGFWHPRKVFVFHSGNRFREMEEKEYNEMMKEQQHNPVLVSVTEEINKRWWMFDSELYWENDGLDDVEVKALILAKKRQKDKTVKNAMALMDIDNEEDEDTSNRRHSISDDVKTAVWRRDQGRCVKCGSKQKLEYDHIIPVAKGGSSTARNIQLLCENCNRSKRDSLI